MKIAIITSTYKSKYALYIGLLLVKSGVIPDLIVSEKIWTLNNIKRAAVKYGTFAELISNVAFGNKEI